MAVYRKITRDNMELWVVPRVLGLAPDDAKWVLLSQGFAPSLTGTGHGEVIGQHPEPNSVPTGQHGTFHGDVQLTIGVK